ncbi:MAG: pilus assembly protein TadG-related protein, partial [Clostridiaceae bacterium]
MKKLDNKGSVSIVLCIFITSLFATTAFALDIGLVYVEKVKLSNAIDSAALAGVLELPMDSSKAKIIAIEYLNKNSVSENQVLIEIVDGDKAIKIEANKEVEHIFASIIGIDSSTVQASTKATVAPLKVANGGIKPFAVQIFKFSYGDLVTLKEGAGDGYNGNYGAVALGGRGAHVFKSNALYGYNGTISVGDYIDTEPGNMASVSNALKNYINSESSSFDNFERDSIRVWTIPLVNSFELNGRGELLVSGFGEFYVENIKSKSGKIEITGRFIKYATSGETD